MEVYNLPNFINCEQAAALAHCSIYTIREAIKRGELKAYKPSHSYVLEPEEVTRWVKSRVVKAKAQ